MSLSVAEKLALRDATEICNRIMSREHHPAHTALALAVFATVVVGDNPAARMALAWAMMRHVDELLDVPRVDETASGRCNGHAAVVLGSR
jgi:hypothetical protein